MLRHACGFALANKGHDTRLFRPIWGTRTSNTRFVTLNWHRIGSRISGDRSLTSPSRHLVVWAAVGSCAPLVRRSKNQSLPKKCAFFDPMRSPTAATQRRNAGSMATRKHKRQLVLLNPRQILRLALGFLAVQLPGDRSPAGIVRGRGWRAQALSGCRVSGCRGEEKMLWALPRDRANGVPAHHGTPSHRKMLTAGRLRLQAWRKENDGSDFKRRLTYQCA